MNISDLQAIGRGAAIPAQRAANRSRSFHSCLHTSGLAAWICAWLFLCVPAYAIDRDRGLDQLEHAAWTHIEGAPGEVRALAQTTDGYLWLGTATGLFRFDGIRFQPYQPQSANSFPQRSVASLFATNDGGLWVGYWYGGVSFIKNGTVTDYGTEQGLPSQAVLAFACDLQGAIWVAAGKGGLAKLKGSHWKRIGEEWGFASEAYAVFVDHAGTLWVGTPTSVAYLLQGGHRFQIAAQHLLPFVHSFAEGRDGRLWMAEGGYGVRPLPLPGKSDTRNGPAVLVGSLAIAFDQQGSLWITSAGNGIRRVPRPESLSPPKIKGPSAWQFHDSEVEAFTQRDGLTSDYVYCVLQDREGNVWIGTSGGLDRFRQGAVVSVPLQPVLHPGAVPIPSLQSFTTSAIVPGNQKELWVAGMGPGVLLRTEDGKVVSQLRDLPVHCAYRDSRGVLWLATSSAVFRLGPEPSTIPDTKPGAIRYTYRGAAVSLGHGLTLLQLALPRAGGLAESPQLHVNAITQDQAGRLWIATESGTFRLEASGWTSLAGIGGPPGSATAEFTDSRGRIWFGLSNTVAMLDGNNVRTFTGKDGLRTGAVTSIQSDGTRIWCGGEFGLEYLEGDRFRPAKAFDGSAFDGVSGIVADPGGLWFSDNRGIIHIPGVQRGPLPGDTFRYERFDLLDGLTAELRGSLASPSAAQTSDGRIWFATTKGLAWIDPKRVLRNPVPPPVSILSVTANGKSYESASSGLRLPARTANLQITYTATSLTVPERVRFRYELKGQDKEWQDAGTRREAFYTNLAPGSYTFRVIACNNDGVWNETGALLKFSIAPAYFQTAWFRAACAAIFLGLVWLFYRLRVRRVEQRYLERARAAEALAAQAAMSVENTRLNRDLRDRERRIRRLVDSNIIGIVIWDLDGRVLDANDAFLRMVRYDREDLQAGLRWFDMTPPEWQEAHARYEAEELKTTGRMQPREKEYFRKDGTRVPVLIGAACFEDQPTQGVAYILDLSEQKRAEEALRRSEAYLAEAQRLSHTGSCAIDGTSRRTVYWSDEMFRIFGFDSRQEPPSWEEFVNQIHPQDRDKVREASDRTFRTGENCDVEFRVFQPDGTVRHIHGAGHPVLGTRGELVQVLGTMVDITERKRAEEERERLRQVQADLAHVIRVSTMGELTASLAHEIKQPIGAAVINAETCCRLLDRDHPDLAEAREAALEMACDARRAADIIDRVRSIYQKGSFQLESVDLNELIEEMAKMMSAEASRRSVRISLELASGLPEVTADRVQLQQAVMNLMLNGIEAMRDMSGELGIQSGLDASGQVLVSVRDTGVGLPSENTDQIFHAFFTTKPQGTGLGLAITRSVIESHGGRIWATANSGPGATFHFTLPGPEGTGK